VSKVRPVNPSAPHPSEQSSASEPASGPPPTSDHLGELSLRLDELLREGAPEGRLDAGGLDRGRRRALELRLNELERELASAAVALKRESAERVRLEGLLRVANAQASAVHTDLLSEREQIEEARSRAEQASRAELETAIKVKELAAELAAQKKISAVELDRVKADLRRAHRDYDDARGRQADLDAAVHRMVADAKELEADLDRVAASRAWRWGHALMRFLKRLTFRRDKGAGGMDSARKRARRLASGWDGR
jgi:hypothetical protein